MAEVASIFLWFNKDAEDAARFYAETFPESSIGAISRAPGDYPAGEEGDALTVSMTLCGLPVVLLNGGPEFTPNESFSIQVSTSTQKETDELWNAITGNGGQESACGWCKDKWGYSWQITPRQLTGGMADSDPAARRRVFEAMMTMRKIDIAAIEAARAGEAAHAS